QALGINCDVTLDTRDLLASVITLLARRIRVFHALRVHDQERAASAAPLSGTNRANGFFLTPAPAGSLPPRRARSRWSRTECTVRQFGKLSGNRRHWQPLLSKYSTAQNTSYRSTVRGRVFFLAPSNNRRTCSNCSRLMSLG